MTTDTSDRLTAAAVADELGLSIKEIYDLVATGDLEAVAAPVEGRRGRWMQIERSELDRYRAAHRSA